MYLLPNKINIADDKLVYPHSFKTINKLSHENDYI